MRTKEELQSLVEFAKEQNMSSIEIDGVKFNIPPATNQNKFTEVPELSAEQIVTPLSVLDDMDEDEITYWSTPFYDELIAKKEAQKQMIKEQEVK